MKLKKIFALSSLSALFFFTACVKEENEPDPEFETTFILTENQAEPQIHSVVQPLRERHKTHFPKPL